MKKLALLFTITFGWSTIYSSVNSLEHIPATLLKANEEKNEQQIQDELSTLSRSQAKEITVLLLTLLDDVHDRLAYWQTQKLQPFSYFITRGPFKWFSSKPQFKEVQEHCEFLQQEANYLAYYIGAINEQKNNAHRSQNTPQSKEAFYQLLSLINQPLLGTTHGDFAGVAVMEWSDLIWLYQQNEEQLDSFYYTYQGKISAHTIPNHFHRHWVGYSLLGVTALAATLAELKDPSITKNNVQSYLDTVKSFCTQNMINPIKTGLNTLFTYPEISYDGVQQCEQTLGEQTEITLAEERPEMSEEEINREISQFIKTGDSPVLSEIFVKQFSNPVWNLTFGRLVKVLLVKCSKIELDFKKAEHEFNTTLNALRPIIASLTILSGSMFAILGGTVTVLIYNKIKSDPHEKIKTIIHTVHESINIQRVQEKLKNIDNGLTHYWIWKLKGLAEHIDIKDRSAFLQDLKLLASFSLSREQKLTAIEQMYRRYSFLRMY